MTFIYLKQPSRTCVDKNYFNIAFLYHESVNLKNANISLINTNQVSYSYLSN